MKNFINTKVFLFGIIAASTAAVMVFVVIPQFPQVNSSIDGLSTSIDKVEAWGDWSGSGDYGSGCCDYTGDSYDTGWGDWSGTGDYGSGCCDSTSGGGYGGSYTPSTPSTPDTPTYTPPTYVPPPTPAAVCHYLTASASSVKYGGDTVYLSWSTSNAGSVSISGIGSVAASGSNHPVSVSSDTTFTLTATSAGGNGSCAVTITVQPPLAAVCNYLNSSHVNVPVEGATVTLSWSTTNASSVSISGVGNVSPVNQGQVNVFVSGNRTFTLTAVGTGGNGSCTVSIGTNITNKDIPRCEYLRANVGNNVKRGDRITLTWATTNADMVHISPMPGGVSRNGSETVILENDVNTFTLTARNFQTNNEATCTVTVRVDKEDKTPTCDLKVSKSRVNRGEKVTLSWKTTDTEGLRIRDDQGKTIFDISHYSVSERRHYKTGEVDVIVNRNTEFIMNVRGEDNSSRTCRVEVTVGGLEVYEKRDQGYVIALTQVPYTGFEAGAFLTFLFYAVLTLWALFIAYVLVIKKGTVLGFSLYGATAGLSETDVENRKKVEALVAKYSGQNQK